MNKVVTTLFMSAALLFVGMSSAAHAQFTPAPTDGPRFTITSSKAVDEYLRFLLNAQQSNIWVDFNGDGAYQDGEELKNNAVQFVKLKRQTLTFYGDFIDLNSIDNQITQIELTDMPSLSWLKLSGNSISELDLKGCPKLEELYADENKFTALDLSKNPVLRSLTCYNNEINDAAMTALIGSLPQSSSGAFLFPFDPKLVGGDKNVYTKEHLELAKAKNWKSLDPDGYDLFGDSEFQPAPTDGARLSFTTKKAQGADLRLRVKIQGNNAWVDLNGDGSCQSDERLVSERELMFTVSSPTVSVYGVLEQFDCDRNEITEVKITNMPELDRLTCSDNEVSSIEFGTELPKLNLFNCANNKLTSLELTKMPKLKWLYCDHNELSTLDLSKLPDLYCVHFGNNGLSEIDLTKQTNLVQLYCMHNKLNKLDVSKNPKLEWLYCYNNEIKKAEMQKLIESLPIPAFEGNIVPYNVKKESNEKNDCTPEQVKLATSKKWIVLDIDGKLFPGVIESLKEITSSLPVNLIAKNGELLISGLEEGMPIEVYTLDGCRVYANTANKTEESIALPAGGYVLRIGNYSAKAVMP